MKKILILILSCRHPVYEQIRINGIDKTWNSISTANTKTYYYYGNNSKAYHDENNIYVTSEDSFYAILNKTLETFEYCLQNFDFDYIFRTNSSSYVNKKKLSEWLDNKPIENFYSGVPGINKDVRYASGCGYSISRDLVEYCVKNKNKIDFSKISGGQEDDLAIGTLLKHIDIFPAPRQDVECNTEYVYDIENQFHYRCKCQNDRSIDIAQMQNIHNKIIKNELNTIQ